MVTQMDPILQRQMMAEYKSLQGFGDDSFSSEDYREGYQDGYPVGYEEGYKDGYDEGFNDGVQSVSGG